jgi:hypothetical protein
MAKSSSLANGLLLLLFNNTAYANVGNAGGLQPAGVAGSFYLSLHTADPGLTGTSEAAYGAYARVAVARSSAGFTVTAASVALFAAATFPAATNAGTTAGAGVETELFWGLWTEVTGGTFLYGGVLGANVASFTGLNGGVLTIPVAITTAAGIVVGSQVACYARSGDTLPTGITAGTVYFVKTISTNQVTLSATSGGAAITLTADGDGYMMKVTPVSVSIGVTPSLTTGFTITEG